MLVERLIRTVTAKRDSASVEQILLEEIAAGMKLWFSFLKLFR